MDDPNVSHSDAPGLPHRETENRADCPETAGKNLYQGCSKEDTQAWLDKTEALAELAQVASDLVDARRQLYMMAGMVAGLMAALWMILLFQRGHS